MSITARRFAVYVELLREKKTVLYTEEAYARALSAIRSDVALVFSQVFFFFYLITIFVKLFSCIVKGSHETVRRTRNVCSRGRVFLFFLISRAALGDGGAVMKNRPPPKLLLLLLLLSYPPREKTSITRSRAPFKCIANTSSELLGKLRAGSGVGEIFTRAPETRARKGCFQ